MNRTLQWIVWGAALIAINIPAVAYASFSLFGTAEGTSIFSVDYLIAAAIVVAANFITLQLFLAIIKQRMQGFIPGLITAVILAASLYLAAGTFSPVWLIISAAAVLAGLVLLIREWTASTQKS